MTPNLVEIGDILFYDSNSTLFLNYFNLWFYDISCQTGKALIWHWTTVTLTCTCLICN